MNGQIAGWYPDPSGRHEHRYWDGTRWTESVSNAGVQSADPVQGPSPVQPLPAPLAVGAGDGSAGVFKRGWRRFRGLPKWAQIASWVGLIVVIAGLSSIGGNDSKKTEKTVAAPATTAAPTTPTSAAPTTTTAPPTTTAAPTTKLAVTTTVAPPTTLAPTTTRPVPATTQAPAGPTLTASQQQAVRSAQSYLKLSGFSRQGLIDQLSSQYGDKFPVADATVAVDSLNVNWNEQAVRSAQSYLKLSGFSCQGMIDQLSSNFGDKYTVEQARYGATQVGLC